MQELNKIKPMQAPDVEIVSDACAGDWIKKNLTNDNKIAADWDAFTDNADRYNYFINNKTVLHFYMLLHFRNAPQIATKFLTESRQFKADFKTLSRENKIECLSKCLSYQTINSKNFGLILSLFQKEEAEIIEQCCNNSKDEWIYHKKAKVAYLNNWYKFMNSCISEEQYQQHSCYKIWIDMNMYNSVSSKTNWRALTQNKEVHNYFINNNTIEHFTMLLHTNEPHIIIEFLNASTQFKADFKQLSFEDKTRLLTECLRFYSMPTKNLSDITNLMEKNEALEVIKNAINNRKCIDNKSSIEKAKIKSLEKITKKLSVPAPSLTFEAQEISDEITFAKKNSIGSKKIKNVSKSRKSNNTSSIQNQKLYKQSNQNISPEKWIKNALSNQQKFISLWDNLINTKYIYDYFIKNDTIWHFKELLKVNKSEYVTKFITESFQFQADFKKLTPDEKSALFKLCLNSQSFKSKNIGFILSLFQTEEAEIINSACNEYLESLNRKLNQREKPKIEYTKMWYAFMKNCISEEQYQQHSGYKIWIDLNLSSAGSMLANWNALTQDKEKEQLYNYFINCNTIEHFTMTFAPKISSIPTEFLKKSSKFADDFKNLSIEDKTIILVTCLKNRAITMDNLPLIINLMETTEAIIVIKNALLKFNELHLDKTQRQELKKNYLKNFKKRLEKLNNNLFSPASSWGNIEILIEAPSAEDSIDFNKASIPVSPSQYSFSHLNIPKDFWKPVKEIADIGPRKIPGWDLEDVSDDGNCFYYAIALQIYHAISADCPATKINQNKTLTTLYDFNRQIMEDNLEPHIKLRQLVGGDNLKNGYWAEDKNAFHNISKNLKVMLAVVHTLHPDGGFTYYVDNKEGKMDIYTQDIQIPDEYKSLPILKIAATGNHFLSVTSHPAEFKPLFVTMDTSEESNIDENMITLADVHRYLIKNKYLKNVDQIAIHFKTHPTIIKGILKTNERDLSEEEVNLNLVNQDITKIIQPNLNEVQEFLKQGLSFQEIATKLKIKVAELKQILDVEGVDATDNSGVYQLLYRTYHESFLKCTIAKLHASSKNIGKHFIIYSFNQILEDDDFAVIAYEKFKKITPAQLELLNHQKITATFLQQLVFTETKTNPKINLNKIQRDDQLESPTQSKKIKPNQVQAEELADIKQENFQLPNVGIEGLSLDNQQNMFAPVNFQIQLQNFNLPQLYPYPQFPQIPLLPPMIFPQVSLSPAVFGGALNQAPIINNNLYSLYPFVDPNLLQSFAGYNFSTMPLFIPPNTPTTLPNTQQIVPSFYSNQTQGLLFSNNNQTQQGEPENNQNNIGFFQPR